MTSPETTPEVQGRLLLDRYEKTLDCVHCGLCLSVCPTYAVTRDETQSPRGRIHLMRAVTEGRLAWDSETAGPLNRCLGCLACESLCPSGVDYRHMLEATREELHAKALDGSGLGRAFRRFLITHLVSHPRRVRAVAPILRGLQRLRLDRLAAKLPILPTSLRALAEGAPMIPRRSARRPLPRCTPGASGAPHRGRVVYFSGCVMPQLFGALQHHAVEALAAQGFEVLVPKAQTCCGALAAHEGDLSLARALLEKNLDVLLADDPDWIVLDAAGCGAALAEAPHLLQGRPGRAAAARALSEKVVDILDLYHRLDLEPRGYRPGGAAPSETVRAAYDAPCHLLHAQGVDEGPRAVMARAPGVAWVALEGAEDCCGAAGIHGYLYPEQSRAILEKKLDQLERSGAQVLFTGNPGCLMQWRQGVKRRGLDIRVEHPAWLL